MYTLLQNLKPAICNIFYKLHDVQYIYDIGYLL